MRDYHAGIKSKVFVKEKSLGSNKAGALFDLQFTLVEIWISYFKLNSKKLLFLTFMRKASIKNFNKQISNIWTIFEKDTIIFQS